MLVVAGHNHCIHYDHGSYHFYNYFCCYHHPYSFFQNGWVKIFHRFLGEGVKFSSFKRFLRLQPQHEHPLKPVILDDFKLALVQPQNIFSFWSSQVECLVECLNYSLSVVLQRVCDWHRLAGCKAPYQPLSCLAAITFESTEKCCSLGWEG